MKNIWFISDTHFGHENIIHYAGRPFEDTEEMDQEMIELWNERVKPEDTVYHLGDVAMNAKYAISTMRKLNGSKRLIVGNHDDIPKLAAAGVFQRIRESQSLKLISGDLDGVWLTHRPVCPGKTVQINVHGHIHHRPTDSERHINLCVEAVGYAPIHIDTLKGMVAEVKGKLEFDQSKQALLRRMVEQIHPD